MSARVVARALALMFLASSGRAQDREPADVDSQWDAVLMLAPRDDDGDVAGAKSARARPRNKVQRKQRRASGAGYAALKASWHGAPIDGESPSEAAAALPSLEIRAVGQRAPCVLSPERDDGGFDADDVASATQTFGGWAGGPSVHPRLLDLIYRAVRHFDVPYVHLVSGVRRDRQGSRHSHGLAADIVLPGVSDEALAAFFRPLGFVGVGVYTRAGFVHIDVREESYFWVDRSPPGKKRARIEPVRMDEAKAADVAAVARGEQPHVNPDRLSRALHKRAATRRNAKKKRASTRERDATSTRERDVASTRERDAVVSVRPQSEL